MISLSTLKNTTRPVKKSRRVGRGAGSGRGKTCGRGEKGAGARSGWKERATNEGGQFPLFRKVPVRGFTNTAFKKSYFTLNLWMIERWFNEGEMVNEASLRERGLMKGKWDGVKVLGNGELTKKVKIEVNAISSSAKEKCQSAGIDLKINLLKTA